MFPALSTYRAVTQAGSAELPTGVVEHEAGALHGSAVVPAPVILVGQAGLPEAAGADAAPEFMPIAARLMSLVIARLSALSAVTKDWRSRSRRSKQDCSAVARRCSCPARP